MQFEYYFTVFTPTYNRAHSLPNVYQSLCQQTYQDFEWIIIDDGSTDDTYSLVIAWQNEGKIPIRFFQQNNSGKHIAFNKAVKEARGVFFINIDSDDACKSYALSRLKHHCDSLLADYQNSVVAVVALCENTAGELVGEELPSCSIDSNSFWQQFCLRSSGDRWAAYKTEILLEFPFPTFKGEKFLAEGIVWNRIANKYKSRFINDRLQIVDYQPNGLSASSLKNRANNPKGTCLYYKEFMGYPIPYNVKMKTIINYIRFSMHDGLQNMLLEARKIPIWFMILLPVGLFLWLFDKVTIKLK